MGASLAEDLLEEALEVHRTCRTGLSASDEPTHHEHDYAYDHDHAIDTCSMVTYESAYIPISTAAMHPPLLEY